MRIDDNYKIDFDNVGATLIYEELRTRKKDGDDVNYGLMRLRAYNYTSTNNDNIFSVTPTEFSYLGGNVCTDINECYSGLYLSSFENIASNITPSENNTYSLGSPDLVWKDVYIGSGSLHIGNTK
jgi:hypothetical protein